MILSFKLELFVFMRANLGRGATKVILWRIRRLVGPIELVKLVRYQAER